MSNTLRHTASCIEEFFLRLAEAIRQGKSDVQVLKRFILAAIQNHVLKPYYRNVDGEYTLADRETVVDAADRVEVPINAKDTKLGWHQSAEVYFAMLEEYSALKCEYPEELAKEAEVEILSIIRNASRFAAKDLGLAKSPSLDPTSVTLDFELKVEDFSAKLIANFAKDGDFTYLDEAWAIIEHAKASAADAPTEPETVTA